MLIDVQVDRRGSAISLSVVYRQWNGALSFMTVEVPAGDDLNNLKQGIEQLFRDVDHEAAHALR